MKIGYFFWGHLSDKIGDVTKDTPDGNAWYSSSIIQELMSLGHEVYLLGEDRDLPDRCKFGPKIFKSFEYTLRSSAYTNVEFVRWEKTKNNLEIINPPKLDLILLEWRFEIEGRNTEDKFNDLHFQPDLYMQNYILEKYNRVKTIIFDLDYKLTLEDEKKLQSQNNCVIFETSYEPKQNILQRHSVQVPFWIRKATLPITYQQNYCKQIVYVGTKYERDDVIEEYIVPFSQLNPFKVWFYGNWRTNKNIYNSLYEQLKWKDIQYHNRIGHADFSKVYNDAVCCPLLTKKEYFNKGCMPARIQESLYFGTIPIGFSEHKGIEKYLTDDLIADDSDSLEEIVFNLQKEKLEKRHERRQKLWNNLIFMDVRFFVRKMLSV